MSGESITGLEGGPGGRSGVWQPALVAGNIFNHCCSLVNSDQPAGRRKISENTEFCLQVRVLSVAGAQMPSNGGRCLGLKT